MADIPPGEDWLYHLPAFLDRVRDREAQSVVESLDADLGGVLYHHRGARVPGYDATFIWSADTFELEIDAVGPRSAWAVFDAAHGWDFYLSRAAGDVPFIAWMSDAEFEAEEAGSFGTKAEAVGLGRFSFGLYLQSPTAWDELEARVRETTAPCLIQRPSGRMLVPEGDLAEYDDVLPAELLPGDETAPGHLGVVEAHIDADVTDRER